MSHRYRPISGREDGLDASGEPAEINLAPMIDVLFILLIFLLVTSSFVRESGVRVDRPDAATAQDVEHSAILVSIRADGEIWIDHRAVDLRRVRQVVAQRHGRSPRAPVILAADRSADVGFLVRVMDEIRLAGIEDIAIAAESP